MLKIVYRTFLTLSLMTTSAWADSCRDIDVRDHMNPEMQQVFRTPFQQGNMGWCYAYSTADIVSARLGQHISPMHLGLAYSNNVGGLGAAARSILGLNKAGFFEAGTVAAAFDLLKKRGHGCLEKQVKSEHDDYGLLEKYLQWVADIHKGKSSDDFGLDYAELNTVNFFELHFPTLDARKALAFLKSRKAKTPAQALLMIAESACQESPLAIPKSLKLAVRNKGKDVAIKSFVDSGLNARKPVSFRYNMKDLMDPSQSEGFLQDNFSQHVSTIVGRKQVGDQCVYIVRNSWGSRCDGYRQGIFCNASEGTYQLPAKLLEKITYSAEYIKN